MVFQRAAIKIERPEKTANPFSLTKCRAEMEKVNEGNERERKKRITSTTRDNRNTEREREKRREEKKKQKKGKET